ncbi:hypothetical protein L1887_47942 [Cichorium endivia]|nr:hypothetical protein L1887_47942 [Cichorium endivia]
MSNTDFLGRAIDTVKKAIEQDTAGEYEKAYQQYYAALELFMLALKWEKNPKSKDMIRGKAGEYMERAEKLKKHIEEQDNSKRKPAAMGNNGTASNGQGKEDDADDAESKKLRGALQGAILTEKPNIKWEDVAGLEDAAIRRRFQRRVHISLPDQPARMRMFEIAVGSTPCELKADDYKTLAKLSEGYSGSDISIAVQDALMQPVRKIQTATHYKKVEVDGMEKLTPCSPGDAGALEMSWVDVDTEQLLEPPLQPRLTLTILAGAYLHPADSGRRRLYMPMYRLPEWSIDVYKTVGSSSPTFSAKPLTFSVSTVRQNSRWPNNRTKYSPKPTSTTSSNMAGSNYPTASRKSKPTK